MKRTGQKKEAKHCRWVECSLSRKAIFVSADVRMYVRTYPEQSAKGVRRPCIPHPLHVSVRPSCRTAIRLGKDSIFPSGSVKVQFPIRLGKDRIKSACQFLRVSSS